MLESGSTTVTGLPPAPDAPASPGPAPSAGGGTSPADDARARKRESDRQAKRRQRDREKVAAAVGPAGDVVPPRLRTTPTDADEPAVVVRFKNHVRDARVIEVEELSLERVAESACSTLATVTGDGRFALVAGLKLPNGRTLAADVGFAADSVMALHGMKLTPEATVYAQLVVAVATVAAVLSQVPRMDVATAQTALPDLQQHLSGALGGSH